MVENEKNKKRKVGNAIIEILTKNHISLMESIAILELLKFSIIETMGEQGKEEVKHGK